MLRAGRTSSVLAGLLGIVLFPGCTPASPPILPALWDLFETILLLVLIAVGVALAIKRGPKPAERESPAQDDTLPAQEVAKLRYAHGELTRENYLQLIDDLRNR